MTHAGMDRPRSPGADGAPSSSDRRRRYRSGEADSEPGRSALPGHRVLVDGEFRFRER